MIWADPMQQGAGTSPALASTMDLSATILERAGVAPYFGMTGKSLLPCMDGESRVRDALLIEYNDGFVRMGFSEAARVRTLVTEDWHLAIYKGEDWGELYDRRTDPKQTHNLWDDPAHAGIRAELVLELSQQLFALMDESPRHKRIA
jgi:arylsulfatase A-like enzyme